METEVLPVKDVSEKMKAVCKSLGWTFEKPSEEFNHVYLKAKMDGYQAAYASLSYGCYPFKGRITVTAYSNHDSAIYRYGEEHLNISVSAARPADQIIKEIQRRFVPKFLEIARKAEEIQKRQDEYNRKLEVCMGGLKGGPLKESEKHNQRVHLNLGDIWGEVRYGSDDQLGVDFHNIPAEKVGRILAILREKRDSGKKELCLSGSERGGDHE